MKLVNEILYKLSDNGLELEEIGNKILAPSFKKIISTIGWEDEVLGLWRIYNLFWDYLYVGITLQGCGDTIEVTLYTQHEKLSDAISVTAENNFDYLLVGDNDITYRYENN